MKALLVQDKTSERLLGQCLTDRGYAVVPCATVQEGRELCAGEFFPLIVLDMAHLADAQAFCRMVFKRLQPVPSFVLMTISEAWGEIPDQLAHGIDDFLPRPYQARDVRLR